MPEGLHEVNELSRWYEDRFKKELRRKPAPGLQATDDFDGGSVSLAELKGKTVLIDLVGQLGAHPASRMLLRLKS